MANDAPHQGTLVIVSGPSTVGKNELIDAAVKRIPKVAGRHITFTSRPPRANEVDGVHYHFIPRAEFEARIAKNEFMEHNEFNGNLYGWARHKLEQLLGKHRIVFTDLDVNGARITREAFPDALSIFLAPESLDQLAVRLQRRGMTDDQIRWRLTRAAEEMALKAEFDHVVVNREGQLGASVDEVLRHALWHSHLKEHCRPDGAACGGG